jgi:tRNA-intron lyase
MQGAIKKRKAGGASSLQSPRGLRVEAELTGNGALVLSEQQGRELWTHGCYGKGVLSRSRAERLGGAGRPAAQQRREAPSAANPFHGSGPVRSPRELLGVAHEPVQLTPEETLHLLHAEECLVLVPPLDAETLWARLGAGQARLGLLYFAYQHYRGLGWVVRAGSKMGVDLVLYQDNPGLVHAQHSVLVLDAALPPPAWPELLGIGRVSENVRKTLVMCRVRVPPTPASLEQTLAEGCVVEELTYRRWATNRTRDAGQEDAEPDWSDD